ncbi:unnamed protein product [Owenia fusiformis]|uniref:Uncharacterized protein n=1 Tax=Owenia fusiformis TaxID=6347 RepID=A0A8J1U6C4_OWEFU|nr:unnamed protein product [Owenia fusiformis]
MNSNREIVKVVILGIAIGVIIWRTAKVLPSILRYSNTPSNNRHSMKKKLQKINEKGEYLPFYGYTCIAMCKNNDQLKDLERFIASSTLKKYFSPLPVSSYHMTLYNIWCHKDSLIPPIMQWMNRTGVNDLNSSYWLPKEALHTELESADNLAKNKLSEISVKVIPKLEFRSPHLTLFVDILGRQDKDKVDQFRNECTKIFGHDDDALMQIGYHITLAYQYEEVEEEDITQYNKDIQKLESMIKNLGVIRLKKGGVYVFPSMEKFIPYTSQFF